MRLAFPTDQKAAFSPQSGVAKRWQGFESRFPKDSYDPDHVSGHSLFPGWTPNATVGNVWNRTDE